MLLSKKEFMPDMALIPEGSFLMGSEDGPENERPLHRVWVDGFGIGRFPVTNKEYRIFVDPSTRSGSTLTLRQAQGHPECHRGMSRAERAEETQASVPPFWLDPAFSDPNQPVVGISWDDAIAYCNWLGQRMGEKFRLPTEAEWERAARGGREGLLYPWGDEPPWDRPYPGYDLKTGGPQRVGLNEPNDFGLCDMSEGVHEWCSDYYDRFYYRYSPDRNPQGPSSGKRRASRGGSWRHRIKFSRCAARSSLPPTFRYADYGFRLALSH